MNDADKSKMIRAAWKKISHEQLDHLNTRGFVKIPVFIETEGLTVLGHPCGQTHLVDFGFTALGREERYKNRGYEVTGYLMGASVVVQRDIGRSEAVMPIEDTALELLNRIEDLEWRVRQLEAGSGL